MAYHDELFGQAISLLFERDPLTQADLRRSVSTAYYGLFHLLISETVAYWNHDASRDKLARMFDHKSMKKASGQISDSRLFPFVGEDPEVINKLKTVAGAFVELQAKRHTADYDNSKTWNPDEARADVLTAAEAFTAWESIKSERIAVEYLVSLLIRTRD
jgi:uncharacterized protein (UPF0332 family)